MPDVWIEELPLSECLRLLRETTVGRIAMIVGDFPLVLPMNYRVVETTA